MVNNPRQFLFGKGSEQMAAEKVFDPVRHYVNLGPNDWASCMPLLIELISNGKPEGHLYARGELMRLARAMDDANNELVSRGGSLLDSYTPDEEVHDAR
tara:strand:+ start:82 stop:378 length:297 start_codon:yes stop_codon:yes gene_type:complete